MGDAAMESNKPWSGAKPKLHPCSGRPGPIGEFDAGTYTELAERRYATEKNSAEQFPRVSPLNAWQAGRHEVEGRVQGSSERLATLG
ncbi:hypothetical protein VTL71DRAFT_1056, partial [Oculimacula yallundae]